MNVGGGQRGGGRDGRVGMCRCYWTVWATHDLLIKEVIVSHSWRHTRLLTGGFGGQHSWGCINSLVEMDLCFFLLNRIPSLKCYAYSNLGEEQSKMLQRLFHGNHMEPLMGLSAIGTRGRASSKKWWVNEVFSPFETPKGLPRLTDKEHHTVSLLKVTKSTSRLWFIWMSHKIQNRETRKQFYPYLSSSTSWFLSSRACINNTENFPFFN